MLEPGMKVPDFTLHDANGNAVSLHDRASKTVVYRSIPRAVFMYDREATTQNKNTKQEQRTLLFCIKVEQ